MIDINELTLGQVNEIRAMARTAPRRTMAKPPAGRYVVVVDRGWIFAGDLSATQDGYYRLDNAVHVFKWASVGFAKMLLEWRAAHVDIRPVDPVEIPKNSVIFRVPVPAGWGMK